MIDDGFLKFALAVWDKGGPVAFSAVLIAGTWWYTRKSAPTSAETQMTQALRDLSATVKANHEAAQAHREEIKDGMSDLGQRVARIEGRMEGL